LAQKPVKAMIRLIYTFIFIFLFGAHTISAQSGNDIIKKLLVLPEFHSISLNSSYTVYVKQTNKQELVIESLKEIYDNTEVKVEDGVLHINVMPKEEKQSKSIWAKIDDIKLSPTQKVYISMKDVKNLQVNGSGKIITENSISSPKINLLVSGSGNIDLDLKGQMITTEISGSGSISIKGFADSHDIHLSGSGALNAYELEVEKSKARLSGSGACEINVTESLDASIHGTAQLLHKGNTKSVASKVFGQGAVKRAY
jgi:hypothetical protein